MFVSPSLRWTLGFAHFGVSGRRSLDAAPARLSENKHKAFQGFIVLGMGFTFDDKAASRGTATSISEMHVLIKRDPRNAERIRPYLGGEEVNNHPQHEHTRYVIDFEDFPLRRDKDLQNWASLSEAQRLTALRAGNRTDGLPRIGSRRFACLARYC